MLDKYHSILARLSYNVHNVFPRTHTHTHTYTHTHTHAHTHTHTHAHAHTVMSQSESVEQVAPEANGDSPFIKPVNEPLFMTSSATSVEPSSAIASAVPVKPYNPQPKKSVLEMTSVGDL